MCSFSLCIRARFNARASVMGKNRAKSMSMSSVGPGRGKMKINNLPAAVGPKTVAEERAHGGNTSKQSDKQEVIYAAAKQDIEQAEEQEQDQSDTMWYAGKLSGPQAEQVPLLSFAYDSDWRLFMVL